MKVKSDHLYQLVHSLTAAEIRYFRQQAEQYFRSGKKDYIVLFDAILSQEKFDDDLLASSLGASINIRYMPQAKKYLYDKLTESLHRFHASYSVAESVKRDIHIARILISKKLEKQTVTLLKRIRKRIAQYHLWEHYPELEETARLLSFNLREIRSVDDLTGEAEAYKHTLGRLDVRNRAWLSKNYMSFQHSRKIRAQDEEERSFLEQEHQRANKHRPDKNTDFLSEIYFQNTIATYSFMHGEINAAYEANKAILSHFDAHPDQLKVHPATYVSAFNNFLIDNMVLGKYDIVEGELDRFMALRESQPFSRMPGLAARVLELSSTLKLNLFIAQNRFVAAGEYIDNLWPDVSRRRSSLSRGYQINSLYIMAYIRFANSQFEEALNMQKILRDDYFHQVPLEMQQSLHLLYLLTHFESGNYSLIESLVQSARRYNSRKRKLTRTEHALFRLLTGLAGREDGGNSNDWMALSDQLEDYIQTDGMLFNYFDYGLWARSRVRGISMAAVADKKSPELR